MAIVTTNRKWFIILTTAAITTFLVMTINSNRYERVVYEKHSIILVEKELPPRTVDKNWRGLDKKEVVTLENNQNLLCNKLFFRSINYQY
jgi:hypothetical protein